MPTSQLMCACAIMLAATTALAGEADGIRRDTPYGDGRKALLADGFLPARVGGCRAPGREEICEAFPEAQTCAGTGFAECEFVFRRPDGARVRIVTRGEALKDLVVHRVKRGRVRVPDERAHATVCNRLTLFAGASEDPGPRAMSGYARGQVMRNAGRPAGRADPTYDL